MFTKNAMKDHRSINVLSENKNDLINFLITNYSRMFSNPNMFFNGSNTDSDPDFIYFNIDIVSQRTEETGVVDPPVQFNETRTQPVLTDCSQYYLTIPRFTINGCGGDLPLWIPVIMTDARQQVVLGDDYTAYDPNMTIYGVTIVGSVSGGDPVTKTIYLEWTSETFNGVPSQSKYYYCYTYSHFVDMFNTAVSTAFDAVVTELGGTIDTKVPILSYNGSTNLFSLLCDSNGFGTDRTSTTESFDVYFDANLYQLLRNFDNVYYPNNAPLTNHIIVKNRPIL
jgi:hypothetical protein